MNGPASSPAEMLSAIGDLISAVVSVFLLATVWLAYQQLRQEVRSIRADHERSRKELAIHLIAQWARNLDRHVSAARKLVETFDDKSCRRLYAQESFAIDHEHLELLRGAFDNPDEFKDEKGPIELSRRQSTELRWRVVTFLNNLESILSAWRHNVADRTMLEEEFSYLVEPALGHKILEAFRDVANGSATFPAVTEFAAQLDAKRRAVPSGRPAADDAIAALRSEDRVTTKLGKP